MAEKKEQNYKVQLTQNQTTINQTFQISNREGQAACTLSIRSVDRALDPQKIADAVAKAVNE